MTETYSHRVVREGLEEGHSIMRISNETRLSICTILREINNDLNLKILIL